MSFYGLFKKPGRSGFGYNSTAEEVTEGLDLTGKRILITGVNSGIGKETARVLNKRGATILGVARSRTKAEKACNALPGEAFPFVCDLSEPDSVRSCVESVREYGEALDAIVANAGIMALPELNQKYGYELQFLTNHIGHFILVTGLVDQLTDDGRVVMLSSAAHERSPADGIDFDNLSGEKDYDPFTAYGQSKLANLLFAKELAHRFKKDDSHNRVAMAVHPGVIRTNLARHLHPILQGLFGVFGPLFTKTVEQGAATQTWAAVHPDAASLNGNYLSDCNVAQPTFHATDRHLAEKLWAETERIVDEL